MEPVVGCSQEAVCAEHRVWDIWSLKSCWALVPQERSDERVCVEPLWMDLNREKGYPISKDHSCRLESTLFWSGHLYVETALSGPQCLLVLLNPRVRFYFSDLTHQEPWTLSAPILSLLPMYVVCALLVTPLGWHFFCSPSCDCLVSEHPGCGSYLILCMSVAVLASFRGWNGVVHSSHFPSSPGFLRNTTLNVTCHPIIAHFLFCYLMGIFYCHCFEMGFD